MLKKKSYIAPSNRTIEIINASEILLPGSPYGEITNGGSPKNTDSDVVTGFNNGDWGKGFPD